MSTTDVNRGKPSLVHVLSTIAAYWRLCQCGLEIGRAGKDGWQQKCERLESELYPLRGEIELLERRITETNSPRRLLQQETKLAKLRAKLSLLSTDIQAKEAPIEAEWEQAHNEADYFRELFWDARGFCTKACGIGDDEAFNAALVGFDPSQLMPGQEPSKQRMPEIVSLLRNVPREEWENQPWANPSKPMMRARRRVSPEKQTSFNIRMLKYSMENTGLQPTMAEHVGRERSLAGFDKSRVAKSITIEPLPSRESSPPPVEVGSPGNKANQSSDRTMLAVDFVESDYAEPIPKSHLALLFDVDRVTIARRIQSGELRVMPGTLSTAKKVRMHGDDFPAGLKRAHERKEKLSSLLKDAKRQ